MPGDPRFPTQLSTEQAIRYLMGGRRLNISAPKLHTITAGAAATLVFPNDEGKSVLRVIQNVGIFPVYVGINHAVSGVTQYHAVLPAGTAANDGLGGVFDASSFQGDIYVFAPAAGGSTVSTIQGEFPVQVG